MPSLRHRPRHRAWFPALNSARLTSSIALRIGRLVCGRAIRPSAVLLLAATLATATATPAMRVVRTGSTGTPLLVNGGFEELSQGKPASWFAWQQGFALAPGEGRGGSQCVVCERREGDGEFGASQTLTLNRTNIAPFIIRGWSKAENVSGSPDNGYSLYVDIIYADGTPLWGQTASFTCGTHDWEQRQFVLLPDKPVKSLALHCLFRGHTGKVWFDDVSLEEVPTPAGAILFQGATLREVTQARAEPKAARRKLSTHDGMKLTLRDNTITSLQLDGKELSAPSPSGFLVRDVAADSDVFAFTDGACQELGLKLEARFSPARDHLAIEGRVTDTTGRDRAITLLFAVPLDATGWHWGDDVRRSRLIEGTGEFANTISLRCGANGKMSLYPWLRSGEPMQRRSAPVLGRSNVRKQWRSGLPARWAVTACCARGRAHSGGPRAGLGHGPSGPIPPRLSCRHQAVLHRL